MYGTIPGVVARPRAGMHVTRAVVAASGLVGVALLALLAVNSSSQRTELTYMGALNAETNPALGSGKGGWGLGPNDLESTYSGENADAPNANEGGWQWATTEQEDPETGDMVMQYGHGPDWSNYFNVYKFDPDMAVGKDVPAEDSANENLVANEQSNDDHHTSEPYTHEASYGVLEGGIGDDNGRSAVANILNFDSWLMDSNGVY